MERFLGNKATRTWLLIVWEIWESNMKSGFWVKQLVGNCVAIHQERAGVESVWSLFCNSEPFLIHYADEYLKKLFSWRVHTFIYPQVTSQLFTYRENHSFNIVVGQGSSTPLRMCVSMKVKSLSHVRLLATSWTAAYQAPPSMGFSRQEYWLPWQPTPVCIYNRTTSRTMIFRIHNLCHLIYLLCFLMVSAGP